MMKTKYIYFLATFLLILFFKFFENSYVIFKNNYQLRLVDEYGFCSKTSYGFIKYIDKKYKLGKTKKICGGGKNKQKTKKRNQRL